MELKQELICENLKVKSLKEKILAEAFEIINSFEYNCLETNQKCWEGICIEYFVKLNEYIGQIHKNNQGRKTFNLSQLQNQRNKLNRQISQLKKETLESEDTQTRNDTSPVELALICSEEHRDKLNKQIETLEKPTPNCYCCDGEKTQEYSHSTINQEWAIQNISEYMSQETCWLCLDCLKSENNFDSEC